MGTSNYSDDFKRDAVHQIAVRGYGVGCLRQHAKCAAMNSARRAVSARQRQQRDDVEPAPSSIVLSGARDSRNAVSWLIAKTAPS
ncbi:hypothetical protein DSD19_11950 [Rhodovulum sp. BSW8]|nr:hypothetical protein DSD19_11950 [Rhodovulum sp. BSW8]